MISRQQKEELDNLEARYLHTRNSRAAKRAQPSPPEPQKVNVTVEPEVHVHIDIPEVKESPKETVKVESPRIWKFKHRYDQYNKLIETTATAE